MLPKRHFREEGEGESENQNKRRNLFTGLFRGAAWNMQEFVNSLEPFIRNCVKEEVDHAIDRLQRSSSRHIDCSGSRTLQLQFCSNLPSTLFTSSRLLSEDGSAVKILLYDTISKEIVTSGPASSTKVHIVVLDGDFGPDDHEGWSKEDFNKKIVQNREGKRPLLTGELAVCLQNGVGQIGQVSFTDNSSWIRSGKFRLGAKAHLSTDEICIREAMSGPFKVKDHRGELYQKHHPPSLNDEVWRLEKIAKDGAFHKRLTHYGVSCVGDFLRLYETNRIFLRTVLHNVSNRTWEIIIGHATSCTDSTVDDKKYMYKASPDTELFFNSIYKVVGVRFHGQSYQSFETLNMYQRRTVEGLKHHAYRNVSDWSLVSESLFVSDPTVLANPATNYSHPNFALQDANFFAEQGLPEMQLDNHHPTISRLNAMEAERENSSSDLAGESSQIQGLNSLFRNSFGMSDSPGTLYGHTWAPVANYLGSSMSTEDLPIDDNFQVSSSAWHGNGFSLNSNNHEIDIVCSDSGSLNPRNSMPKTRWCKLLAVVKWRILVKRNIAAKKWKKFYNYI